MVILSINFSHDGSAVVLRDGRIAGYVNTERFARIKKFPGARPLDLDNVLAQAGSAIDEVGLVILQNYGANYPEIVERYGTDFQDTWPRLDLDEAAGSVRLMGRDIPCRLNVDHFLCHGAAAWYFSPFETGVCFALDPMGSGAYRCSGNAIEKVDFPVCAVGDLYNLVSAQRLLLGGVFGAGKTMGLAPYGRPDDRSGEDEIAAACAGGVTPENMRQVFALIDTLAERHPRLVADKGTVWNASYAWFVQEALERALDHCLAGLYEQCAGGGSAPANLCLGGGTALNSVANQKCFARSRFAGLYLHPACGDDGTAIGAALYVWHHEMGNPKVPRTNPQAMYSIRTYAAEIPAILRRYGPALRVRATEDYIEETADLIEGGKIIGWFQGASEIGPRALGNRSILCDPRAPGMKDTLNGRVKHRESFRPFAPAVLAEHAADWFGLEDSPFMLRVSEVRRPGVPAVTHHDGTARIQTVAREDNPTFHRLLAAFHERTGVPLVVNTSFNVRGEPIVETPADAIDCFLNTEIDHVVFPGLILSKST